jgi:hypothetical protein
MMDIILCLFNGLHRKISNTTKTLVNIATRRTIDNQEE